MIINFSDFCSELKKAGFSLAGGNDGFEHQKERQKSTNQDRGVNIRKGAKQTM